MPSPSFAIISPQVASTLKEKASTPAGRSIISTADANLSNQPKPLPVIHTEGTLPNQGISNQSHEAMKDMSVILSFSFSYRLTTEPRYLVAAERFFSAWLAVYHPSLNPIDETKFFPFILAYDLVREGLSAETREKMNTFLHDLATGYLSQIAQQNPRDIYNWQSHRIKLISLAAYSLGDPSLIEQARQTFQRHVADNIRPDGIVVDFYKRDALHYVVYDLEPLSIAALAAKGHDEDWFHYSPPGGASIAQGVDWLTPFALSRKTHEEFVHSSVPFDAARAEAGVPGFSGQWQPKTSAFLYQLATLFDERNSPIFQQVLQNSGATSSDWLTLLMMPNKFESVR
jgi:Alginate lyase